MSTFDASTGLTCVACRLVFKTAEVQREHYRTDWHRYNLKRQVAELEPVTDEQFREKVLTYRAQTEAKAKEEEENSALYCACCKKLLKSKNAYDNHIVSNKHKEMETRQQLPRKGPKQPRKKPQNLPQNKVAEQNDEEMDEEDDSSGWETDHGTDDEEDLDYNEAEALPVTSCLFCPQTKANKDETLEHMRFHHGFQIPDKQYITDENGLLKYLGLKVGAGRCCIFCPDVRSRFANLTACQSHMRDKEHCKIDRKPERMLEFAEFYDYSPMYEGESEASTDVIYDDGWSLTLPSGRKVGHRSLMIYYRQYLKPVDVVKRDSARAAIDKARGFIPALAWTNTTGVVSAKQAARDFKFIERYRRRFDVRVSCRSSKLFKTQGRVGDN